MLDPVSQSKAGTVDESSPNGTRRGNAGRVGIAEAQAADLRLKLQEGFEREKRLAERALTAEEKLEDAMRNEHDLRDQIDRLATFNRSVEQSAAWRWIQLLRGLVGRRW